jgi:predicted RNA methylase
LNPRTELEQIITADLKRALDKRGFKVKHNGTPTGHAAGLKSDIEVSDNTYLICVEVTKRMKSSQDGEYQSIKDHMVEAQKASRKRTFCLFVSPETYYRTFSSIRDSNRVNAGKKDLKILPLSFSNFELLITKLIEHPKEEYAKDEILELFNHTAEYIDDEAILRLIFKTLFSNDSELKHNIAITEENKHQQTVQSLIFDLLKLEDDLRKNGIATHIDAIRNVIYLVFMKLYEEKREITEQKLNRFSRLGFEEFQNNIEDKKEACHKLFELIKQDSNLVTAKMFNEHDLFSEKMSDKFVFDHFIVPFEKYFFYTTKVDGLGSAYEVLGQLSGKDTKAGQFFTPENIVRFMVMLADLKSDDIVLDFACGTARFLIYAMYDMIAKVSGGNTTTKEKHIKEKQLFGTDFDPYVAKLSKMNMYIHGDGKTNIQDKDGLLLYSMDGQIDDILTNPPLGDLDYKLESYDENFLLKRMSVIPKKNITQEKIDVLKLKLELEDIESKRNNIEDKMKQLQVQLETNPVINVTGNEMKGGHYLPKVPGTI